MFEISLEKPIFYVWAGQFVKNEGSIYRHKFSQHSENFEIFLPTQGEITFLVNNEPITVKENECFVASPNSVIMPYNDNYSGAQSMFWFHFLASWKPIAHNDKKLDIGLTMISERKNSAPLNNSIILPNRFCINKPERIYLLIRELLNHSVRYQYSQRTNDFYISLILIALSDDFLKSLAKKRSTSVYKTATIAEWIRVNLSPNLTLVKIAEEFNLNPNYLSRLFKKEQGICIKNYILNTKFDYAKYLLTTTLKPISEVAEEACFGDTKHFMRIFKQKTGLTPSNYRNQFSHTHMNSNTIDPSSTLPEQFGNKALKKMIKEILEEKE